MNIEDLKVGQIWENYNSIACTLYKFEIMQIDKINDLIDIRYFNSEGIDVYTTKDLLNLRISLVRDVKYIPEPAKKIKVIE